MFFFSLATSMKLQYPVAGFALVLLAICFSSCETKRGAEQLMEKNSPDFKGRLYSSGLSREEAERLQLAWPVYQITGAESYFFQDMIACSFSWDNALE